jgi:signal peptidase I
VSRKRDAARGRAAPHHGAVHPVLHGGPFAGYGPLREPGKPPFGKLGSAVRLLAIILITVAFSLALLIIIQRVFIPFHPVTGQSMAPQIRGGDAVLIKDIDNDDIEVGKVIIFHDPEDPERLVIHRVVDVDDSGSTTLYTTRGDNNPVSDPWQLSPGRVVGGVALKVPGLGSLLEFLGHPKGYIACVAIPAAVALSLVFLLALAEVSE